MTADEHMQEWLDRQPYPPLSDQQITALANVLVPVLTDPQQAAA